MTARPSVVWLAVALLLTAAGARAVETQPVDPLAGLHQDVTQGALRVKKEDGGIVQCPLKHTDVEAEISGFIARVSVTQTFHNPLDETIEAVYVFPLPHKAAVDDMTMVIGDRRIVGVIKRRQAAREIYEEAVRRGATAALLEQERPNIFTQSVGNIKPGQEVRIEISYVDVLEYDMGVYTFHFPMVVGPRYIPGKPTSKIPEVPEELKGKVGTLEESRRKGKGTRGAEAGPPAAPIENQKSKLKNPSGTGWAPDTNRVPDASRITPPVLKPGYRNGHDISLSVWMDAGMPIQDLTSPNHKVEMLRDGPSRASVQITDADSIPNKDFVLKYAVMGEKPEMAVLPHTNPAGEAYFMLMVQPKEDERMRQQPPRELSFLVDVSGSMRGDKTAKVREAMHHMLKRARQKDTVQVITFSGSAARVFPKPVPCTAANVAKAMKVTEGLRGSGGTEMLKGIKAAINDPLDPKRVRIVVLLTDGFIGNEAEIIAEVGRRCGDHIRFWCIGIGQSPNRMLIDGVARQGGGMAKVLGLNDEAEPLTTEIMFRIQRAQLAGVTIDWGDLKVWQTYPARIPELWAGRPIVLFGRYDQGGFQTTITISGTVEGEPAAWRLPVTLPAREPKHDVLAKVWARHKIEELMHTTYYAGSPEVEEAVTRVALDYRLMSQYTSFVAIDESTLGQMVEPAKPPRRMLVPVPIPEGAVFEGFFGGGVDAESDALIVTGGALHFRPDPGKKAPMAALPAPMEKPAVSYYNGRGEGRAGDKMALGRRAWGYSRGSSGRYARQRSTRGLQNGLVMDRRSRAPERKRGAYNRPMPREAQAFDTMSVMGTMEGGEAEGLAVNYGGHFATQEDHKAAAERSAKALEAAEELRKKGDLLAARARFMHAWLLDDAAMGPRAAGEQVADKALAAIDAINEELLETWAKDLPVLDGRLDVVLRDLSIEEACVAIGRAAAAKPWPIRLVAGSAADAAAIRNRRDARVTYLDLRNATVAQALDWLCLPERLIWWVEDGTLHVGSARRSSVASPWVYDVSAIAMPSVKEVNEVKDHKKRIEMIQKDAKAFLKAVRSHLGAPDAAVTWYGSTQILVFGDAKRHAKAAHLFADLADPKATLTGDLADLHKTTSERAKARKETLTAIEEANELSRVASAIAAYSWRLLAEAAGGSVDVEAMTHLQVAWQHRQVDDLARRPQAATLLLRSAWALTQASGLVENEELTALAHEARTRSALARKHVVESLEKTPTDPGAAAGLLYAALTTRNDVPDVRDDARRLLVGAEAKDVPPNLVPIRAAAASLLSPADTIDTEALSKVATVGGLQTVRGADAVVLTALACRRAGGEPWRTFRAEARPLLGRQPLPGSVAVFVGHLAEPTVKMKMAAMR